MTLALLLFSSVSVAQLLPPPTGKYPVGVRRTVLSDAQRKETAGPRAGREARRLAIVVWYPAASNRGAKKAPYMPEPVAAAMAKQLALPPDVIISVDAHAQADAPLASGSFPLLLLDHGLGMVPELYTATATELASHGYVVAAVNHTFTSAATLLSEGVESYAPPWPRNVERVVQGRAMGEYVATWVADDRFVLEQLEKLRRKFGWKRGAVDATRVVAIGHSYGGTTAGVLAASAGIIAGAVNLDGSIYPGMPSVQTTRPLLVMVTPNSLSVRSEYHSVGENFGGVIAGSTHMTYSDAPLLQAPAADASARALVVLRNAALRTAVVEFVNHVVRGTPAPLLNGVLDTHGQ
jgi:predicted dienelactone hydrolase